MNVKIVITFFLVITNLMYSQQDKKRLKLGSLDSLPVFFPLSVDDFIRVSSNYGYRKHPILKTFKKHNGIDLVAIVGTPVKAAANGYIEKADYDSSYGNRIVIKHKHKMKTLYAHLSDISVAEGQQVKSGEIIGYVGETGLATGPHLHYEILINTVKIDPMIFWKLILRNRKIKMNTKDNQN